LILAFCGNSLAQKRNKQDSLTIKADTVFVDQDKLRPYNPLAPAKAAFYSAILPGLGQAYNRKYWKIPLVYGAIGSGMYFYLNNNKSYHRYRDAYKRRLNGFSDDEFQNIILNNESLIDGQEFFQRQRDLALLITIGLYALNVIDANVDAHLQQFNVNEKLTFNPSINQDNLNYTTTYGVSLTFQF
jgi:hypothetical protein